jgi:hypothetical protein
MTKFKIANLTTKELERFAALVKQSNMYDADRTTIAEILLAMEQLVALLRSSNISIHRLKKLMGFPPETPGRTLISQDKNGT